MTLRHFQQLSRRAAIKTKDPSTSALRDRFRPHAICHAVALQRTASIVSCVDISMRGQIYGPGPVHCNSWWKFSHPIFDSQEIPTPKVKRQPRGKVSTFSRLLLFDNVGILRCRAEQPFSTWTVVADGPGKTSLIGSCRPVSARGGRDFSYACREEVEDDGAGIRDPRP